VTPDRHPLVELTIQPLQGVPARARGRVLGLRHIARLGARHPRRLGPRLLRPRPQALPLAVGAIGDRRSALSDRLSAPKADR
jgi:hypothetical protein